MNKPHLAFFEESEFLRNGINWFPYMDTRWLLLTDTFRFQLGAPIHISRDPLALGRELSRDSESDHNIVRWDAVFGGDVFTSDLRDMYDARIAVELARSVGYTAIGFYPSWRQGDMTGGLHLGTRSNRRPGDPATWGFIGTGDDRVQVSINEAMEVLG